MKQKQQKSEKNNNYEKPAIQSFRFSLRQA